MSYEGDAASAYISPKEFLILGKTVLNDPGSLTELYPGQIYTTNLPASNRMLVFTASITGLNSIFRHPQVVRHTGPILPPSTADVLRGASIATTDHEEHIQFKPALVRAIAEGTPHTLHATIDRIDQVIHSCIKAGEVDFQCIADSLPPRIMMDELLPNTSLKLSTITKFISSAISFMPFSPNAARSRLIGDFLLRPEIRQTVESTRKYPENHARTIINSLSNIVDEIGVYKMTMERIAGDLISLFVAGGGTTTAVIERFFAMAKHPDQREFTEKIIEELNSNNFFENLIDKIQTSPDIKAQEIMKELNTNAKHLMAFMRTCVWFNHPAFITPRIATNDLELLGQEITKGSIIWGSIGACVYNMFTGEDRHKFDPYKFIDTDAAMFLDSIAFGSGTRMCPASNLAMMQFAIMFGQSLRKMDWEVDPKAYIYKRAQGILKSTYGVHARVSAR